MVLLVSSLCWQGADPGAESNALAVVTATHRSVSQHIRN